MFTPFVWWTNHLYILYFIHLCLFTVFAWWTDLLDNLWPGINLLSWHRPQYKVSKYPWKTITQITEITVRCQPSGLWCSWRYCWRQTAWMTGLGSVSMSALSLLVSPFPPSDEAPKVEWVTPPLPVWVTPLPSVWLRPLSHPWSILQKRHRAKDIPLARCSISEELSPRLFT